MLLEEGHTVFGIDSELFRRCYYFKPQFEIPKLKRDIRDIELDDLYGFDAVIHLAGLSNDPMGDLNPKVTYDINYSAAVRLASLAKFADIPRFLFSSSCAVYGSSTKRFVNDTSPLQPLTTFALAKMRAEHDIALLADDAFSPVFLRKPTMYGISPYHRTDTAINNLVAWATAKGRVFVKSDGTSWRPFMHVEDVARAFLAALYVDAFSVQNQALNICRTDDNYQIGAIAEIIQDTLPDTRIEYAPDPPPDTRSYRVEGSKIATLLPNWQPRWSVQAGILQLHDAYEDRRIAVEDFEGARFKRVAYLKHLLSHRRLDESLRWQMQTTVDSSTAN
jgi:nucleoside-diphosphate-sugar epimerase